MTLGLASLTSSLIDVVEVVLGAPSNRPVDLRGIRAPSSGRRFPS